MKKHIQKKIAEVKHIRSTKSKRWTPVDAVVVGYTVKRHEHISTTHKRMGVDRTIRDGTVLEAIDIFGGESIVRARDIFRHDLWSSDLPCGLKYLKYWDDMCNWYDSKHMRHSNDIDISNTTYLIKEGAVFDLETKQWLLLRETPFSISEQGLEEVIQTSLKTAEEDSSKRVAHRRVAYLREFGNGTELYDNMMKWLRISNDDVEENTRKFRIILPKNPATSGIYPFTFFRECEERSTGYEQVRHHSPGHRDADSDTWYDEDEWTTNTEFFRIETTYGISAVSEPDQVMAILKKKKAEELLRKFTS